MGYEPGSLFSWNNIYLAKRALAGRLITSLVWLNMIIRRLTMMMFKILVIQVLKYRCNIFNLTKERNN